MSANGSKNSIGYVDPEMMAQHRVDANNDFRAAIATFHGRVNGFKVDLVRMLASTWTDANAIVVGNAPKGQHVLYAYMRDARRRIEAAVDGHRPDARTRFIRETAAARVVDLLVSQPPKIYTPENADRIWNAASKGLTLKSVAPKAPGAINHIALAVAAKPSAQPAG